MPVTAVTQDVPGLEAAAAADGDAIFAADALLARYAKKGAALSDSLPSVRVFLAPRGGDVPGFGAQSVGQRQNVRVTGTTEYALTCPAARSGDTDAGGGVTASGPGSGKRVMRLEQGDRFVVPGWAVARPDQAAMVLTVGGSIAHSMGCAWDASGSVGEVPT